MNINKLCMATLLAMAFSCAQAGTVSASANVLKHGSIAIDLGDNGSTDYHLDVSNLLAFNQATGDVTLVAPGGMVNDAFGQWSNTSITVGGQTYNGVAWHSWETVSGVMDKNGLAAPTSSADPWVSTVKLFMKGNVDPEMNYGFSVKNNSATTQSYTVTFGESLVPTVSGAYTIEANLVGGTSSVAPFGVTVTPNTSSGLMQELYLRKASDGTFVNAGVNVGPSFTTTQQSAAYPLVSSGLVSGNTGSDAYDYWEFRTKFTLTGNKDTFVGTGSAVLTPVPEPESYALAIGGVLMVWRLSSRRLRHR